MPDSHAFITQHEAYLHVQRQIAKAIHNRDERLLVQLKQMSHELFTRLDSARKGLLTRRESAASEQPGSREDLAQIVQAIEMAQGQVQENEIALRAWLDEMKADIRRYRRSQSQRGVLETYMQQRLATPHRLADFENPVLSPDQAKVDHVSLSPWMDHTKDAEMVGHQINQQS